jgi:hypothetical protein
MANSPNEIKFIYRGISDASYELLPSIFRKVTNYDEAVDSCIRNYKYLSFDSEVKILKEFIENACGYIRNLPLKPTYEWVEYAQHHGVPTRFLDWSENPLVALYFACKDNKPSYSQKNNTDGKDAGVWMIHMNNYRRKANQTYDAINSSDTKIKLTIAKTINKIYENNILFEYPLVYKPYYKDPRMSAQSSLFMVWGKDKKPLDCFFSEDNYMRSNENNEERFFSTKQEKGIIYKFYIHQSSKQSILRELNLLGINEKNLFPGLDGIGRYIEMKYRLNYPEIFDCII